MKAGGYFTIEAAVIFSFYTLVVVSFINLGMALHDGVVSDVSRVLGGLRYYESDVFFYETATGTINYEKRICAPVLGQDNTNEGDRIEGLANAYYRGKRLSTRNSISRTEVSQVFSLPDNAERIRAGSKVIQLINGGK